MVVALSRDDTIDTVRENAKSLLDDLRESDIDREEAQRRKDDIIAAIDSIRTAIRDSDGQITRIDT